jgi:hypothetical protein
MFSGMGGAVGFVGTIGTTAFWRVVHETKVITATRIDKKIIFLITPYNTKTLHIFQAL